MCPVWSAAVADVSPSQRTSAAAATHWRSDAAKWRRASFSRDCVAPPSMAPEMAYVTTGLEVGPMAAQANQAPPSPGQITTAKCCSPEGSKTPNESVRTPNAATPSASTPGSLTPNKAALARAARASAKLHARKDNIRTQRGYSCNATQKPPRCALSGYQQEEIAELSADPPDCAPCAASSKHLNGASSTPAADGDTNSTSTAREGYPQPARAAGPASPTRSSPEVPQEASSVFDWFSGPISSKAVDGHVSVGSEDWEPSSLSVPRTPTSPALSTEKQANGSIPVELSSEPSQQSTPPTSPMSSTSPTSPNKVKLSVKAGSSDLDASETVRQASKLSPPPKASSILDNPFLRFDAAVRAAAVSQQLHGQKNRTTGRRTLHATGNALRRSHTTPVGSGNGSARTGMTSPMSRRERAREV